MSHKYYDDEMCKIQDCLASTLNLEPVQADGRKHRQLLASLYVRYIMIANKLGACVDQMVQPQKKLLLRKLLEATLGRILELKTDLVEADLTEWTHCGDIMEHLAVTPKESELLIPTCFRREKEYEIAYRKGVIDEVLNKLGFTDKKKKVLPMTEQQAILVIQTHERARQGRLRAQFMKEIRSTKEKNKPAVTGGKSDQKKLELNFAAAVKIQKVWRGYMARRATRRQKLQEMLLIGMIPPPKRKNVEFEKDLQNQERRRKLQMQRQEEYLLEIKRIRSLLEKTQRGPVLEQLSDQVRSWFHEFKAQTGRIPEYTGSERSASRQMPSRQGTDSDTSKSTPGSSKNSKMTKTKATKSPKEAKSSVMVDDEGDWRCKTLVSTFLPDLHLRKEEYDEWWRSKGQALNLRQYHYKHIIEHEQIIEMENELRKVVDEMMKAELMLLQDAFDKDRGHKGKKKSSKKSRKTMKKSKKKKEKDLTPDRTTESLFEELVANGIIKGYPEVWLKDFIGERSFHPPAAHNKGKEPPFDLGDIRQVVAEYCVIPLLTARLHHNTPHVRSVLLAGPKGSGKDMLVHAICNEIGAVLFDLTSANIVGKYPGKSGLIMLIHLVVKVSRLLQPSVIYMDNAERPFVKKVPKTDRTDPKRLKKDLPRVVKNFGCEDRVILIGATNCPWESDQKLLQQVYQKLLVIPRPNYSSRYSIWTDLLNQFMPISWKFDISVMSKISDGYTAGSIVSAVKEVITVKRMLQLRIHPLSPFELVNALCKRTPVYKEEGEALELWWSKAPTVRRRLRAVEALIVEEQEIVAKQATAKKK